MRTVYSAPSPTARAEVELSILYRPTHTVVRLRGDLDIATAPPLRGQLLGVPSPGVRLLILDLSGVSFCDAAGLALLINRRRRATLLGIPFRLIPSPQVTRLLRITGLAPSLASYPATRAASHRTSARSRQDVIDDERRFC